MENINSVVIVTIFGAIWLVLTIITTCLLLTRMPVPVRTGDKISFYAKRAFSGLFALASLALTGLILTDLDIPGIYENRSVTLMLIAMFCSIIAFLPWPNFDDRS